MFSFKSKKALSDFASIGVEMHSHLLPGIDDGVKTIGDSIKSLRGLSALGYTRVITTPHVFQEYYPNTSASIQQKEALVRKAIEKEGLSIQFSAAAEYYLDEHFEMLLKRKDLLTLADNRVLIEMSFFSPYPKLINTLFEMQTKGFKPILAHPERYEYYGSTSMDIYQELRDRGCKLQANLLSFVGYYGKNVQRIVQKMAKMGLIDYLGTDMHTPKQLPQLQACLQNKWLQNIVEQVQNSQLT